MTKLISPVVAMLVFVVLMPQAGAGFTKAPTFDLMTSSNLAGATDAVYTLRAENRDEYEDAYAITIVIPAGYSIGQSFITNKAGVKAMSVYGKCPGGSGEAGVITTTTPGLFSTSWMDIAEARTTIVAPSATAQGEMKVVFPGGFSLVNRDCYGEFTTAEGFFINPSNPGTYTWAPSTAQPTSGPSIEMVPRPGFTQTVEIVSPSVTTQSATSTTESSTVPATTVVPPTTQTTVQPATTTVVVEPETSTTAQPPPTGGGLPTEMLAIVAVVLIVIVAGAVYALRRRE